MAIHEPHSHWWSDTLQTEFRLPQKRYRSDCILPRQYPCIGFGPVSGARRITKAILAKVRGFFRHQPPAESSVSCADPVEAYMHACITAMFFCYVSPELYGLTVTIDEQGVPRKDHHQSGDDS